MPAIIRKELADHFSSLRFSLMSTLIFMAALVSAHLAGDGVRAWLGEGLGAFLEGRTFLLLYSVPGAAWPVFTFIAYLGPLAAIMLSFDSINRERREGTLAKILAQPVYRDEVLLGKYLAGLFTMALMLAALLLFIAGFGLAVVGLVPTWAEVPRLMLFWLLSVIYLGFWLGAAMLMSILCRGALSSALASAALWIFMAFFVSLMAGGAASVLAPVADPLRPARDEVLAQGEIFRKISLASPVNLYNEGVSFLLDPSSRTLHQGRQLLDKAVTDRYTGRYTGPLELGQSLILVIPHLAAMLALTAFVFWLSYLAFMRQEIRSN